MIHICNAFPNSFLPIPGAELRVKGLSEANAKGDLAVHEWVSHVGHQSFADVLSARLGIEIPANRTQCPAPAELKKGDRILIAAVQPPRRLAEGEVWTEEEILSMPIAYVEVYMYSWHP